MYASTVKNEKKLRIQKIQKIKIIKVISAIGKVLQLLQLYVNSKNNPNTVLEIINHFYIYVLQGVVATIPVVIPILIAVKE